MRGTRDGARGIAGAGGRPERRPESPAPVVTPEASRSPLTARFEDEVRERVLAMVAEKTGYPQDMLDLELDLEADLGVDTVKQAELFATVREAYGIARDDQLKLRDFPTLDHVIGFVLERARPARPARRRRPPEVGPISESPAPAVARGGAGPAGRARSRGRGPRAGVGGGGGEDRLPARTCWIWTWTWRRTSGSTPSSRPSCSPRSGRPTASRATTSSSCATFPRSTT